MIIKVTGTLKDKRSVPVSVCHLAAEISHHLSFTLDFVFGRLGFLEDRNFLPSVVLFFVPSFSEAVFLTIPLAPCLRFSAAPETDFRLSGVRSKSPTRLFLPRASKVVKRAGWRCRRSFLSVEDTNFDRMSSVSSMNAQPWRIHGHNPPTAPVVSAVAEYVHRFRCSARERGSRSATAGTLAQITWSRRSACSCAKSAMS